MKRAQPEVLSKPYFRTQARPRNSPAVMLQIPHILDVVDITEPSNKKWFDLYRYEIPVLHYEGREIMRHRIDLERLRAAVHPKESP